MKTIQAHAVGPNTQLLVIERRLRADTVEKLGY